VLGAAAGEPGCCRFTRLAQPTSRRSPIVVRRKEHGPSAYQSPRIEILRFMSSACAFRRYLLLRHFVGSVMPNDPDASERKLLERIIAWRSAGWTFAQIGAQLEAEGLDPRDEEHWERAILRHLVRQREGA
jgi:hypothetical protein